MKKCCHCDNHHAGVCPRVKSIEYYGCGSVKRVEYHPVTVPVLSSLSVPTVTFPPYEITSGVAEMREGPPVGVWS
jgi:hypothetical protein